MLSHLIKLFEFLFKVTFTVLLGFAVENNAAPGKGEVGALGPILCASSIIRDM